MAPLDARDASQNSAHALHSRSAQPEAKLDQTAQMDARDAARSHRFRGIPFPPPQTMGRGTRCQSVL